MDLMRSGADPSRWFFKSGRRQSQCSSSEEYNVLWIWCDSGKVDSVVDLVSCRFWSVRRGSLAVVPAGFEGGNPSWISLLLRQRRHWRLLERNGEYRKEKGEESYDAEGCII
ncbi:hypothetical protein GmHk_01G002890 [Glycine max]|nr:hypothetical protein GYH30_002422 [Glycine max]KAH1267740.1 hypothetical protein GmHk_01G002890 [Glycine max]